MIHLLSHKYFIIVSAIFIMYSCTPGSPSNPSFEEIKQLDLSGDITVSELKSRLSERESQIKSNTEVIKKMDQNFKGYDHLIKTTKDIYRLPVVLPYKDLLPAEIGDKKRGEIYECVNSTNIYYKKILKGCDLGAETFNTENGLLYIGKSFYSKGKVWPYSQGDSNQSSSQDYGDDASGPGLIFVRLYELGLQHQGALYGVTMYNFINSAANICNIKMSSPHEKVIITEYTLDLPNANIIHSNMRAKGFYKYIFNENNTPSYLREKYYALTILINKRILIIVTINNENYGKYPKEFKAVVNSCQLLKNSIDYEKAVSLSTIK